MDLIAYDEKKLPIGQGFRNLGATCYFNSILQCLLSCPSIFQVLEENKHLEHIATNELATNLLDLYNSAMSGQSIENKCIPIWRSIMNIARSRKDNVSFDMGQQDAHEGLMLFLNLMDYLPEVKRLFKHRYKTQITCDSCKKFVVNKVEENLTFEVPPDLKTEQHERFKYVDINYNKSLPLNEFLRKQNGSVDENFICPECSGKNHKFKSVILTMIPEILPIVIKKYYEKKLTPFPAYLEFVSASKEKKLIYKLVAQSEHSGNMQGGHYWAIGLRADGWKLLNDSSVSDGTPGPTHNTYLLFYHYEKTIDNTNNETTCETTYEKTIDNTEEITSDVADDKTTTN